MRLTALNQYFNVPAIILFNYIGNLKYVCTVQLKFFALSDFVLITKAGLTRM